MAATNDAAYFLNYSIICCVYKMLEKEQIHNKKDTK